MDGHERSVEAPCEESVNCGWVERTHPKSAPKKVPRGKPSALGEIKGDVSLLRIDDLSVSDGVTHL